MSPRKTTKPSDNKYAAPPSQWDRSPGCYITGRAALDAVDELAIAMERKWGCGRLRLLVPTDLRERFDKQRYHLNKAIQGADLGALLAEAERMQKAWVTLDRVAIESGAAVYGPEVWETVMSDGVVLAVVPDAMAAKAVTGLWNGRKVVVVTLDEVGRLMEHFGKVKEAKLAFPGAIVERVTTRSRGADPLDDIPASGDWDDHLTGV